ncbi:MAG: sulfurtransferase [Sedimentibacter sp.]
MKSKFSKSMILMLAVCVSLAGCATKSSEPATEQVPNEKPAVEESTAFEGKYLVNTDYVKENASNENVLLIDARGEDVAKEGTIEGSIALKWQMISDVNGKTGDEMWGTILPPAELSEKLSGFGISKDKEIIVFGAAQNGWGDEGRIVWELCLAGFENVKMVDGGFDALASAGLNVVNVAMAPTPAEVVITELNNEHNINTEALKAGYDSFKVVDTRTDVEYEGKTLYGEANGGHLPGAILIKYTDLFNEDGLLKSNADIEAMFIAEGINKEDKVVTYCTAGIRSAYMELVLEMCGFENSLNYDESFYRWSAVNELEK